VATGDMMKVSVEVHKRILSGSISLLYSLTATPIVYYCSIGQCVTPLATHACILSFSMQFILLSNCLSVTGLYLIQCHLIISAVDAMLSYYIVMQIFQDHNIIRPKVGHRVSTLVFS